MFSILIAFGAIIWLGWFLWVIKNNYFDIDDIFIGGTLLGSMIFLFYFFIISLICGKIV